MTSAEDILRQVSARLAPEFDPNLPAWSERVLAEGGQGSPAGATRYLDLGTGLALASFVLAAIQTGLALYTSWESGGDEVQSQTDGPAAPSSDAVERRIRVEVELPDGMSSQDRDRIVVVVVEEIKKARADQEG